MRAIARPNRRITLDKFVTEASSLYRATERGVTEMSCLYLDNFRGFRNSIVPLLDVNFLVGENSSGKTSVLITLLMFSGPDLFMAPDYQTADYVNLSPFNEMVSAHSSDRTYFRLGYASEPRNTGGKKSARGTLITYENVDGLAQISRVSTTMGDTVVHIRYDDDKVYYKNETYEPIANSDAMCGVIQVWARAQSSSRDESWDEIKLPYEETRRAPLVYLMTLARSGGNLPKEISSFSIPYNAPSLVWIAPIRSAPKRIYEAIQTQSSPEGAHIPYVIRRMLNSKEEAIRFKEFTSKIGEASGLFQKIEIERYADSDLSPFEVKAYLDDAALGIGWMGYGVSQSLPIFVELLDKPHGSWFAIQQPEVHLHPRAQACLGDVFFEMADRDHKKFLIETHSDFTIDRFRLNYRNRGSVKRNKALPTSQIYFFERKDKTNIVTPIPIGPTGELPSDQPESYREFFIKEEMKVLGI